MALMTCMPLHVNMKGFPWLCPQQQCHPPPALLPALAAGTRSICFISRPKITGNLAWAFAMMKLPRVTFLPACVSVHLHQVNRIGNKLGASAPP